MTETTTPAKPRRAWLPLALLVLWVSWIAFLAWVSHPYWGASRTAPTPDARTESLAP